MTMMIHTDSSASAAAYAARSSRTICGADRVQLVGAVERDGGDAIVHLVPNRLVAAHGDSSSQNVRSQATAKRA